MSDTNERLEQIEYTLGTMNEHLAEIRGRLDRGDERSTQMEARIAKLAENFSGRITKLDEDLSGRITTLDENLSGRITKLDERLSARLDRFDERLTTGLAPLKELRDFVQRIADEHERRISELEKRM